MGELLSNLMSARAVDLGLAIVDFGLVYLLMYQVLLLIRGTRGVQLLAGLLVVIVIYFVSKDEYLGLSTLHWLLDKFIGSFFLVMIVLFQNDIRRGLSNFGETTFLSGLNQSQNVSLVEELVKAANLLARSRVGALIAIEREASLRVYAEEGVPLGATVTKETLFAIFNPGNANPLHDGAVVISGDNIVAAGCFVPLSSNPRIEKTLGTRHRAAIGLSEDTDAVVLVVSEETGFVSVATAGKLVRNLDANNLRSLLYSLIAGQGRKGAAGRPPVPPTPEAGP